MYLTYKEKCFSLAHSLGSPRLRLGRLILWASDGHANRLQRPEACGRVKSSLHEPGGKESVEEARIHQSSSIARPQVPKDLP
jgi:hypothetical protein